MFRFVFMTAVLLGIAMPLQAGSWSQFRGSSGGVAEGLKLPTEIGPDKNVLWKIELPPGHSSPIIHGDRIFVTAIKDEKLFTIGLDRATGKTLWQQEAPHKGLEKIHKIGSHCQPTPATDGQRVVSFFSSAGLHCYDLDGKPLWSLPLGPFKNDFGAGSSPIIVDNRILLNCDHDSESFLVVVDKLTGKEIKRLDRSQYRTGYSTPIVWEVNGKKQLVVCGTLRVVGFNPETLDEIWTVRGLSRIINMTPSVGPDGTLYVAAWAPGGDPGQRISFVPFDEVIAKQDANKNGTLEADEAPAGPFKDRFSQVDADKNGHVTKAEYEGAREVIDKSQNKLIAIKPGGTGDITESHVLWSHAKDLPYVPSPILMDGKLFFVKNGGIVTSVDVKTGKPTKTDRVRGNGDYYASPVGGDGKIYVVSKDGDLSVLSVDGDWKTLWNAEFNEEVYATPAIVDGKVYLRTRGHLYCFGSSR
jgi:outer membrane protein assembly factor BamB